MSKFEYLDWDSNFFGFKVGRIKSDSQEEIDQTCIQKKTEGYKLIYVFSSKRLESSTKLVDQKVIFELELDSSIKNRDLSLYEDLDVTHELLQLALESGQFSRFKLDNHFPEGTFEKLYSSWISKSVSGEYADQVLTHTIENSLAGMVTVKKSEQVGHIGLIAVSKAFQSKGIGTELMEDAKFYFKSRGCGSIEVPTQLDNEQACFFYRKQGFVEKSVDYIYHYWL